MSQRDVYRSFVYSDDPPPAVLGSRTITTLYVSAFLFLLLLNKMALVLSVCAPT